MLKCFFIGINTYDSGPETQNQMILLLMKHCECFRPGYVTDIPATRLPAVSRPTTMPWRSITARVLSSPWKTGVSSRRETDWLISFDNLFLTRLSAPPGRFEQAFINSLLSESGANGSTHYWMGLMEAEDSKEYRWLTSISNMPLTFTNWNKHQPGAFALVCWSEMSSLPLPASSCFTKCSFSSLSLVSTGGCVAMSGGPALGQWEVKNCSSFKALSLCKQDISGYQEVNVTDYHPYPNTPCAPGWQSRAGLFSCYKVGASKNTLFYRLCCFCWICKSSIVLTENT